MVAPIWRYTKRSRLNHSSHHAIRHPVCRFCNVQVEPVVFGSIAALVEERQQWWQRMMNRTWFPNELHLLTVYHKYESVFVENL